MASLAEKGLSPAAKSRRGRSKGPRDVRAQNRINTLRTPHLRALAKAIKFHHLAKLPKDHQAESRAFWRKPVVSPDQAIAEIDGILADIRAEANRVAQEGSR